MKVVVVGLGDFGYAAAVELARKGAEVIAIDRSMPLVERIKDQVSLAASADSRESGALDELGVPEADVLIAGIGSNFEAQVLTVVYAAKVGIPHILARAVGKDHSRVLRAVGAHEVLNPEEETAHRVAQRLIVPDIRGYFELAEGFSVTEVGTPPDAVGKTLAELQLRTKYRLNVIAIKHAAEAEGGERRFEPVPQPDTRLAPDDLLALVGSDLDVARFVTDHGG
jgi:trk system potassium uptake protein TrkA